MNTQSKPQYMIGDVWEPAIEVKDADGNVIDLSDYTVRWALKRDKSSDTYAADSMPVTGVGSSAGASATVTSDITAEVAPGTYWEEFELSIDGTSPRKRSFDRIVQVSTKVIRDTAPVTP